MSYHKHLKDTSAFVYASMSSWVTLCTGIFEGVRHSALHPQPIHDVTYVVNTAAVVYSVGSSYRWIMKNVHVTDHGICYQHESPLKRNVVLRRYLPSLLLYHTFKTSIIFFLSTVWAQFGKSLYERGRSPPPSAEGSSVH